MSQIGLAFYTIKVLRNKKKKNELCVLGNINGKSITEILYDYSYGCSHNYKTDISKERIARFDYAEINEYKCEQMYYFESFKSIIKNGNFGLQNEIIDSSNGRQDFIQEKKHASVKPFGMGIYINKKKTNGILVIQTFGASGIKEYVVDAINEAIKQFDKNLSVVIKQVVLRKYLERIINDSIFSSITIEKTKKISSDKDERINKEKSLLFESSVIEEKHKKPLINSKKNFTDVLLSRKPLNEVLVMYASEDEIISNFKLECNIKGQVKTFNYNTFYNMKTTENITNEVYVDNKTGYPEKNSLFDIMDKKTLWFLQMLDIILNDPSIDLESLIIKCKKYYIMSGNDIKKVKDEDAMLSI